MKLDGDSDLPRFGVNFSLWPKISPNAVSHLFLHCNTMAAQGEDTVVVNKNKRFRKAKRVNSCFSFVFRLRREG